MERNARVFPHAGHNKPVISRKSHCGRLYDILIMYCLNINTTAINIIGESVNMSLFVLKVTENQTFHSVLHFIIP